MKVAGGGKQSWFTVYLFLVYLGLSLNVVVVMEGLTTRRVCFAILLFSAIVKVMSGKGGVSFLRSRPNLLVIILFLFLLSMSVVSFIASKGVTAELGVYFIFSIFMQLLSLVCFILLVQDVNVKLLVKLFLVFGLVLSVYPFPLILSEFDISSVSRLASLRNFTDSILPRGQNFYLTFLTVFISVATATAFGVIRERIVWRLVSFIIIILSIGLFVVTGSRQFVLTMALIAIAISLFSVVTWQGLVKVAISVVLVFLALVSLMELVSTDVLYTIYDRVFSTSFDGGHYDAGRMVRYEHMVSMTKDHFYLGAGPNSVLHSTGLYSDSSWLQILGELGVISFIVALALVVFISTQLFLWLFKSWADDYNKAFFCALLVCFFSSVLVVMFLNDVLVEYYFWLLVPILTAVRKYDGCTMYGYSHLSLCHSICRDGRSER